MTLMLRPVGRGNWAVVTMTLDAPADLFPALRHQPVAAGHGGAVCWVDAADCRGEAVKWSEHSIARAISVQTLARKCLVLVDNCGWTGYECDVLGVTMDMRIIDVEVKISRADLKADAKKDKWWNRVTGYGAHGAPHRVSHPRKVWKHYYALPKEIWKPELLDSLPSESSGILLLRPGNPENAWEPPVVVQCLRRATPARDAYRLTPAEVLDIARLANLRMWEAYKRRDEAQAVPA